MVMFTVKRGSLGNKARNAANLPEGITSALYLNILGIIVLGKEPAEHFDGGPSQEPPQAFGVNSIAEDFGDVMYHVEGSYVTHSENLNTVS